MRPPRRRGWKRLAIRTSQRSNAMQKFLTGLPGGWSLAYETNGKPFFVRGRIRRLPFDVARMPEGRSVFYHVKRWLDIADMRMEYGAQYQGAWKAADMCKMAMEATLKLEHRWTDELLENDVNEYQEGVA